MASEIRVNTINSRAGLGTISLYDDAISFNTNIGIGTTNPQYKLDVNGNLNITENVYINGTLINLSSIDYGLITGSVDSSTDYGSIV